MVRLTIQYPRCVVEMPRSPEALKPWVQDLLVPAGGPFFFKNKQPANSIRITSSPEGPCCTRDHLGHAPRSTLESVTLLSELHCCSTNIFVLSLRRRSASMQRGRSSHSRTLAFPVTSPAFCSGRPKPRMHRVLLCACSMCLVIAMTNGLVCIEVASDYSRLGRGSSRRNLEDWTWVSREYGFMSWMHGFRDLDVRSGLVSDVISDKGR
jgi:hypothetical protein